MLRPEGADFVVFDPLHVDNLTRFILANTFSRQTCRSGYERATPGRWRNFPKVTRASIENRGTVRAQVFLSFSWGRP